MAEIIKLLVDPERSSNYEVSAEQFPRLVKEMRELYELGSQSLGEAVIKASALQRKKGSATATAIAIYSEFLITCPSPFYKDIAKVQRAKLIQES